MFNRMTLSAMQRPTNFITMTHRFFAASYRDASNPVVWMNVSRNGADLGQMKFEVSFLIVKNLTFIFN